MTYEMSDQPCKRCGEPVPCFYFGIGHWYVTKSNAERGPYCSLRCVEAARKDAP